MRLSARTDYAIRAAVELAAAYGDGRPLTADRIAEAQRIPTRFLLGILNEMRHAGLLTSRRGQDGGYRLARPPDAISLAAVIRAIDGPLANVAGTRPEALHLTGAAAPLQVVWIALRSSIRAVLERVTLEDVIRDELPDAVTLLAKDPGAWEPH